MKTTLLMVLAGLLAMGCDDEPTQETLAATDAVFADATPLDGAVPELDEGTGDAQHLDASPDAQHPDAQSIDAEVDAASPALDASIDVDAAVDDPWDGRPAGQCVRDDDCASGACNVTAPGGLCTMCGPCQIGHECLSGTCQHVCADDQGCPLGLRCAGVGVCAFIRCEDDAQCPTPYVCGGSFCERPTCGPQSPCPTSMSCVLGICFEP